MKNDVRSVTGGCLCGAVRYVIDGPLRDVVNCHCSMCQRLHGGFGPHAKAAKAGITITRDDGLAWYRSSDIARRGFCHNCGSGLFWEPDSQDGTGILAGTIDQPTGLHTIGHIFVSDKSDYYDIHDDLPRYDDSSEGKFAGDFR